MAISFGAWLTGVLWLIAWSPWVGVFSTGLWLGLSLIVNAATEQALASAQLEVEELQKQVVGLRTTIDRMVRMNSELEGEYKRAAFRRHGRKDWSSSSL